MTNTKTFSVVTGLAFVNPGNAYDNNASTFADGDSNTVTQYQVYKCGTSATTLATVTLNVDRLYSVTRPDAGDINTSGKALVYYSWDNTTFYVVSSVSAPGLGETVSKATHDVETFSIPVPNQTTNLNSLYIRFSTSAGVETTNDPELGTTRLYILSKHQVYEISLDYTLTATSGTSITVTNSVAAATANGTTDGGKPKYKYAITLSTTFASNQVPNTSTWICRVKPSSILPGAPIVFSQGASYPSEGAKSITFHITTSAPITLEGDCLSVVGGDMMIPSTSTTIDLNHADWSNLKHLDLVGTGSRKIFDLDRWDNTAKTYTAATSYKLEPVITCDEYSVKYILPYFTGQIVRTAAYPTTISNGDTVGLNAIKDSNTATSLVLGVSGPEPTPAHPMAVARDQITLGGFGTGTSTFELGGTWANGSTDSFVSPGDAYWDNCDQHYTMVPAIEAGGSANIEISLDGGTTWRDSSVQYTADLAQVRVRLNVSASSRATFNTCGNLISGPACGYGELTVTELYLNVLS